MLVYVDDMLWITRDKMGIEKTILIIYFMTVLGLPFAWKKNQRWCGPGMGRV